MEKTNEIWISQKNVLSLHGRMKKEANMKKVTIPFTKMHGLGNDYIYVDCTQTLCLGPSMPAFDDFDWADIARRWSDRHLGIGGDGVVLILPSATCDFRMRIFNADGSEAQMCGNASRCIGKYVYERRLTRKTHITLETLTGTKTLDLQLAEDIVQSVCVDMGKPLSIKDIQLFIHGQNVNVTTVDVGNPHAILFYDQLECAPVELLGPIIECAPAFPHRTNVEFAAVVNSREIDMRVWERGSGETMACGTGACAAVVAAIHRQLTEHKVVVHLRGGDLQIALDDEGRVQMTGPATFVFDGEIEL